ncbi:MAG TPA: DMT family transporter [Pseudolabrys sp.]|nr:DMT family transporter [Pseudolabrys sp.]
MIRKHSRVEHVPLGIAYMLGATLTFAASQALSKWLVADFSFAEVLAYRGLGSLAICSLLILPQTGLAVFRTQRLGAHVGRNATQAVAQAFFMVALSLLPLGAVVAINFSSPIFAALFAALYLHEKIGRARGLALVIGFLGVVLVASPRAASFNVGLLFAVANAVMFGSITAAVRGLTATETAETLTMYQMVLLTIVFVAVQPLFGFSWPAPAAAGMLIANGVLNGIGQYWWTRALSLAPPAAVGPFYYFTLVWAMILGFLVWGDLPTVTLIAGSAIVAGSGLYLLWHERTRRAAARAAPPTVE